MAASVTRGHYKHLKFAGTRATNNMAFDAYGCGVFSRTVGRIVVQLPRLALADLEFSVRATGLQVPDLLKLTQTLRQGISGKCGQRLTAAAHGRLTACTRR